MGQTGGREWKGWNCKYTWKVLDYKSAEVVNKRRGKCVPIGRNITPCWDGHLLEPNKCAVTMSSTMQAQTYGRVSSLGCAPSDPGRAGPEVRLKRGMGRMGM